MQPHDLQIFACSICYTQNSGKLEEASTHRSANTHASTVFVTNDIDLLSFDSKITGFPGLILEHLYVKLGDPSCISVYRYHAEKQTYRQMPAKKLKILPCNCHWHR